VVEKAPLSSLLQQCFILPSVPGVAPHLSPKGGLKGVPSLLGGCVTPIVENGVDFRLDGLIQYQKWSAGFGPSRKLVVWDQGDEV